MRHVIIIFILYCVSLSIESLNNLFKVTLLVIKWQNDIVKICIFICLALRTSLYNYHNILQRLSILGITCKGELEKVLIVFSSHSHSNFYYIFFPALLLYALVQTHFLYYRSITSRLSFFCFTDWPDKIQHFLK